MPVGKVLDTEVKADVKTIGFYVGIAAIGFFVGTTISKTQSQDELIREQHKHTTELINIKHSFALDEVSGVRSDMNREVQLLHKRIDELKNGK